MARRGHGEGTKHRRSDGRWEWRLTLPDGERRSFYGKTEREARDKKNAALLAIERGEAITSASPTVAAWVQTWLDASAERVRPSTLAMYRRVLTLHVVPRLGRVKLRDLTAAQVNRSLAGMVADGLAPSTANRVRGVLRAALADAQRQGIVTRNAASLATPRREAGERVAPYTPEEARQLIARSREERYGPLLTVALATGLRLGELLALRWEQVDLDARTLRVVATLTWEGTTPVYGPPKSASSRRTVRLTGVALDGLRRARAMVATWRLAFRDWQDHGLVFPTMKGTPQHAGNVTPRCQDVMRRAGVPVKRFHDLRHFFASTMLAEGVDMYVVKEMLGHSTISTTVDIYGHLVERAASDAADALDRALGDDDSGLRAV